MNHLAISLCLGVLAGCATAGGSATPVGEVSFAGQTYPIYATADGAWQIKVEGMPETCRKATVADCYWSLRNILNAQANLEIEP